MEFSKQRPCLKLAKFAPLLSRLASYLGLYLVELGNALNRGSSEWRVMGHMQVVELAPDVRPAGCLLDPAAFVKMMEAGSMWRAT
jgi:hypothetical protein